MKRILTVNAILALGLGSIFLLPANSKIQESAIIMDLPPLVGDWTGGPREEASEKVKGILQAAAYENRTYTHDLTGQVVRVSMVLSSDNINQSIHRPERCLPAQGQQLVSSQNVRITVDLGGKKNPLHVTELATERRIQMPEQAEPVTQRSNIYYLFVGNSILTNSHYERTKIDMVDRLIHGRAQRWAYIMLDTPLESIASNTDPQEGIADLMRELLPDIVNADQLSF